MLNKFQTFMIGRYGYDQLGKGLLIFSASAMILSSILSNSLLRSIAYVSIVWFIFRFVSKNKVLRINENRKYIDLLNKSKSFIKRDRKNYKYFKCQKCKRYLKVPRRKGKIEITCPSCKNKFIKKT